MEKINDSNLYKVFIIVPLVIALFTGGVSLYSKISVEPAAAKLISSAETMKQGYVLLREPQLFAGYRYWDSDGTAVKNTIRYFDFMIFSGGEIKEEEKVYLELLLDRRKSGSMLGLKTAMFMLIISAMGGAALYLENRKNITE
ncbi:MAG TPA: hypothetical protein P5120_01885 [Spirochaetota bacterium]|nr:hypothetical protein [Spirochaetota bacterium]HPF04874.1 hypothetical protein [Spirochaetota bacterium]HPJ41011.1 hypothetical protein [Spirochaetota bacterium]HPR37926.1 hypothetical protein [Spirochaetota bacterium]HRX46242.1 hypothetical protein [Spirochaetota bacterium]